MINLQATDTNCTILQEAIHRYKSIIFQESRSALRSSQVNETPDHSIRGTLTGMLIQKLQSCETMPHDQMDESCT